MKVLINSGRVINVFAKRDRLINAMKERGHEVSVCGYELKGKDKCREEGVGFEYIAFSRASLNPIADLKMIHDYSKIITEGKYDVVHGYTAKPNIYGSIAARLSGVKQVYPTINGLGYAFTGNSFRNKIVRTALCALYRIAFACSTAVFFQNQDDADEMVKRHVIRREKCVVISGSGIDLEAFPYKEPSNTDVFLLASRLLITKGLKEYFEAARMVKARYPRARFLLAGATDPNPDGIEKETLDEYIADGTIEYLGQVNNMPEVLAEASVFVLPSFYREGVPHANLEAMSVGRAVITTNMPGCKETVRDADQNGKGRNGFLIEPRNSKQLADKMIWMIEHPEEVKRMGIESNRYAKERFDVQIVNAIMLKTMGL